MLIERIEVRLVELPLVEPFRAAHGTTTLRQLVIVRAETDVGIGWGECSALPEPTYTDEFAGGAFVVLAEHLAPRLVGRSIPADMASAHLDDVVGHPMAKAALEMTLLDVELRRDGRSLATCLGAVTDEVRAGAAVGIAEPGEVTERVAALAAEGFGRVKLKVRPGHDLAVVAAVSATSPEVEIQVDANGAYGPGDLGLLIELAASGITAIEQPFAVADRRSAATLVANSPVPIVADEAAVSTEAVDRLYRDGALSAVSIKPPRLGGIVAAVELHDWCVEHGVIATAGGMIESGLGRHALAAVAALPGFALTGDLSPSGRWLRSDPWPDLRMAAGMISIPSGPGIAPEPDAELLDHHTTRRVDVS